jgi:uncharacterized DUF497 family protein
MIREIIWLEPVVEKLEAKHGVSQDEVEELLSGSPKIRRMKKEKFRGEDVNRALGQTDSGRYLVFFHSEAFA